MIRWFSRAGAVRGIKLALFAAALWSFWALGYLQGVSPEFEIVRLMVSPDAPQACCQAVARI